MQNRFFRNYSITLGLILFSSLAFCQDEASDDITDHALEAIQALEKEESATQITDTEPSLGINETDDSPVSDDVLIAEEVVDTSTDSPLVKDVILVLDNSGSMKKNDPQFLTSRAVTEFINSLDDATRVAIIIFDQNVRITVPLTDITSESRELILKSLEQINYKGLFTDSPAAIERAIYELKLNGREDAKKLIVFMTDGIVDTGDKDRDLEKSKWLKEDLAADAADSEISIFGIAFTEDADFELIQSLAQNTDGEYYRALKPEDLNNVFSRVHVLINKRPEPEPVPEPVVTQPEYVQPPPPPVIAPPPPVIIEVPVQPQGMDAEERKRTMLILVALTVLIIAVIVMVIMLIRGARKKDGDDFVQEAYFNDVNGYTSQPAYKLSGKPTMLGRVAGKDTDHLDYIVVPETTIGRRHALIEYKDYAYWIVDQGSINGTFVNDQLVSSEIRLKHGDRVRLHKCEFEFSLPEDVDAGMTQISKTVLASQPVGADEDVTVAVDMPEGSDIDIPDSAFDLE